jgi:hypothetical protein
MWQRRNHFNPAEGNAVSVHGSPDSRTTLRTVRSTPQRTIGVGVKKTFRRGQVMAAQTAMN